MVFKPVGCVCGQEIRPYHLFLLYEMRKAAHSY